MIRHDGSFEPLLAIFTSPLHNSKMKFFSIISLLGFVTISYGQQVDGRSPPSYPSPWGHGGSGWKDAYAAATAFVSQLTLLEKVNLTTGTGWTSDRCVGNTGSIPRLGLREFCLQDSPLGVRFTDGVSAFPAGMNAAATWSTRLMKSRGRAMGEEFAGKGIDIALGPVAGALGRIPAAGRNWEGFSPDPVLTGIATAETIRGIQDAGVIACAKHLIGNEQEHYRDFISSNIDDRTMHELYLWPFADAVRAGAGSVMCSYNRLNDSYACQNSYLLNHLLKNELDFQGFVMSDWGAQHSGVASALAGLDMTMPGEQVFGVGTYSYWGGNLTAAVLNGTIPQWRIDDMALRIMAAYFKVGRDKSRVPINFSSWTTEDVAPLHWLAQADNATVNEHVNVQSDHARVINEIATRSIVLLKNVDNALPLKNPESILVAGEDAHLNPKGPNGCPDRGCDEGHLAMGWGSGTANFPYLIAPVDAIRDRAIRDGSYFRNVSNNYDLAVLRAAASNVSTALVFANADSGEAFITVDGNAGDRTNLTLWQGGDELVRAVAEVNRNTILILHTVGPVLLQEYQDHPNITGILWAGLPGQESGNSLVDILYGVHNPSGKTVFTWGKNRADWGVDILYNSSALVPQQDFTEGNLIDYRWFDAHSIEPTYPFGYGLSYTTFSYSNLQVRKLDAGPYEPNTGNTEPAPTYGTIENSTSANAYPPAWPSVKAYVYPFVDSTTGIDRNGTNGAAPPGSQDGSLQPRLPAGGGPGGNKGLWDELYEVSATVTNTGRVEGVEVTQLYVALGGDAPVKVLRGFDDLSIRPGESKEFRWKLRRRDLARWDVAGQNWVVGGGAVTVFVGGSSRDLPLSAVLP
jgi:beta-glucosidase